MEDQIQAILVLVDVLVFSKYSEGKKREILGIAAHERAQNPTLVPSDVLLKRTNNNKQIKNKIELLRSNSLENLEDYLLVTSVIANNTNAIASLAKADFAPSFVEKIIGAYIEEFLSLPANATLSQSVGSGSMAHTKDSITIAVQGASGYVSQPVPKLPGWLHRHFASDDMVAVNRELPADDISERIPFKSLPASAQEYTILEDLLFAMMGIEGRYITMKRGDDNLVLFDIDASVSESIASFVKRILPLCSDYYEVHQFIETKVDFSFGRVVHALCAAIHTLISQYLTLISFLEQKLNEGLLTLQILWHEIQISLRVMQAIRYITFNATKRNLFGGQLLNLIHQRAQSTAGDPKTQEVYLFLLQKASVPYWEMLKSWLYKGTVRDPYHEFLIEDNAEVERETNQGLSQTYWDEKYTLRQSQVATFLESVKQQILDTGKYINVFKQCGIEVKHESWERNFEYSSDERVYILQVEKAHQNSSQKLLEFLMKDNSLTARLRSMKHFFLLDQGDWVNHFLELAEEELRKESSEASVNTLQAQLELAIRSSTCKTDPYCDDIRCEFKTMSLLDQALIGHTVDKVKTTRMSAMESLALTVQVGWPLQLIFDAKSLQEYQLLFRLMLYTKHIERLLSKTWKEHQFIRQFPVQSKDRKMDMFEIVQKICGLRHRCVCATQAFLYYMTQEVFEPEFQKLEMNVKKAKTIEDLRKWHREFLDSCLRRCFVPRPQASDKADLMDIKALQETFRLFQKIWAIAVLLSNLVSRLTFSEAEEADGTHKRLKQQERDAKLKVMRETARKTYGTTKVEETFNKFDRNFSLAFSGLLQTLGSGNWAPELLTKLNFNDYQPAPVSPAPSAPSSNANSPQFPRREPGGL